MNRRQTAGCRSLITRAWLPAVAILAVVGTSGCRGRGYFAPPGPMGFQQANAVIHDPYPLDDIGPSDLGARPPSYQVSVPEPVRNRLIPDAMPQLGR